MVTARSFLYQSRPGDARNAFRNSSSLLFALRLPEPLHQFLGEVGREFHHGACQRAESRLGFAATASASASTPAWRGLRRSSARPASVGSRVDLDAAALAMGHAIAAAPHKGLLPDRLRKFHPLDAAQAAHFTSPLLKIANLATSCPPALALRSPANRRGTRTCVFANRENVGRVDHPEHHAQARPKVERRL